MRDSSSPYVQAAASRTAVDMVSDDMKAATKVEPLYVPPWPSGTVGATLTVPARGTDTSPETIVYSWAGPGQPLMRQYNSNTAVSIADNVQAFKISFTPEMLLMDNDAGVSAPGGSVQVYAITNTHWVGEYFVPTLPAGTTSWTPTHVKVQLQRNGTTTGTVSVGIYAASGGLPTGSALASGSIDIATVSATAATWANAQLTPTVALTPGAGYCLVLGTSSAGIGSALFDTTSLTNTTYCSSTNGSTVWTAKSGQTLEFYLYGSTAP